MQANRLVGPLAFGVACGIAAGAVAALWARIAMRMVAIGVADGVGIRPEFTVPGTFAIVLSGMVVGVPAALLYAFVADRIPGPARWRGVLYAGFLLALVGPFFFRIEEFFSTGRVLLFVPPFVLYGIVLGIALAPLRRAAVRWPAGARLLLALTGLATVGVLAFGAVASVIGLAGGFQM
jgi:hypothetical protein